jgi:hypothetical protein
VAKIVRLKKADIKSGKGSLTERALRRRFKQATQIKKVWMCRGCSRPKTECNCPRDMREAVRRYHAVIERIRADGRALAREDRIKQKRAKFKVYPR